MGERRERSSRNNARGSDTTGHGHSSSTAGLSKAVADLSLEPDDHSHRRDKDKERSESSRTESKSEGKYGSSSSSSRRSLRPPPSKSSHSHGSTTTGSSSRGGLSSSLHSSSHSTSHSTSHSASHSTSHSSSTPTQRGSSSSSWGRSISGRPRGDSSSQQKPHTPYSGSRRRSSNAFEEAGRSPADQAGPSFGDGTYQYSTTQPQAQTGIPPSTAIEAQPRIVADGYPSIQTYGEGFNYSSGYAGGGTNQGVRTTNYYSGGYGTYTPAGKNVPGGGNSFVAGGGGFSPGNSGFAPGAGGFASGSGPGQQQGGHNPNYKLQPSKEFWPGRVLKIEWAEPMGQHAQPNQMTNTLFSTSRNDFFVKDRRFVIYKTYGGHSQCVPILTYGNRACTKSGVNKEHHGVVFTGSHPVYLPGEPALGVDPVLMVPETHSETLSKTSRINYAKSFTIEHNYKVYFIGSIDNSCMGIFLNGVTRMQGMDITSPSSPPSAGAPNYFEPATTSTNYYGYHG